MPRLRTIVAFVGGIIFAVIAGFVPGEVISSLREWAGRPGPDPDADPDAVAVGKKRRARRKKRPST